MAAQSAERDNRTMDSPQHHRAPHAMRSQGRVAPINLGLPLHAPHPAPGNDPFLVPAPAPAAAPVVYNDPFLAPPALAPAVYGGQQYNHLPAALAQQLAALPPIVQGNNRGRGRGRGCGQGHGHGHAPVPVPAPAALVCCYSVPGCF